MLELEVKAELSPIDKLIYSPDLLPTEIALFTLQHTSPLSMTLHGMQ
jgi:hypothetical protein